MKAFTSSLFYKICLEIIIVRVFTPRLTIRELQSCLVTKKLRDVSVFKSAATCLPHTVKVSHCPFYCSTLRSKAVNIFFAVWLDPTKNRNSLPFL